MVLFCVWRHVRASSNRVRAPLPAGHRSKTAMLYCPSANAPPPGTNYSDKASLFSNRELGLFCVRRNVRAPSNRVRLFVALLLSLRAIAQKQRCCIVLRPMLRLRAPTILIKLHSFRIASRGFLVSGSQAVTSLNLEPFKESRAETGMGLLLYMLARNSAPVSKCCTVTGQQMLVFTGIAFLSNCFL